MDAILIVLAVAAMAWAGFQSIHIGGASLLQYWQSALSRSRSAETRQSAIVTQLKRSQVEFRNSKQPPSVWRTLVVADIVRESSDSKTFVFVDPSGDRLPSFLPGQHLLVESPAKGFPILRRCYSLSHGPGIGLYQITVKRKEVGTVETSMSHRLHDHVAIGDLIRVRGPQGNFTSALAGQSPVVLMAAGIGITPMLSMLEGLVAERPNSSIWLYYQVRDASQEVFGERLRQIARKYSHFQLRIFHSRSNSSEARKGDVFSGKFGPVHIHREIGSEAPHFFMCGPDAWMKRCAEGLEAIGHPSERIHYESFGGELDVPVSNCSTSELIEANQSTDAIPKTFQVHFERTKNKVEWRAESNLLDLAVAANAAVESGCRSGNCGSCVTRLLKGNIRYRRKPDCEVNDQQIALCVAEPTSDLELDA